MSENNWKPKFLLAGTMIGAVVGLATAYFMAKTAEESSNGGPPQITTGDALKTGLNVVGLVRGIAALGGK